MASEFKVNSSVKGHGPGSRTNTHSHTLIIAIDFSEQVDFYGCNKEISQCVQLRSLRRVSQCVCHSYGYNKSFDKEDTHIEYGTSKAVTCYLVSILPLLQVFHVQHVADYLEEFLRWRGVQRCSVDNTCQHVFSYLFCTFLVAVHHLRLLFRKHNKSRTKIGAMKKA